MNYKQELENLIEVAFEESWPHQRLWKYVEKLNERLKESEAGEGDGAT